MREPSEKRQPYRPWLRRAVVAAGLSAGVAVVAVAVAVAAPGDPVTVADGDDTPVILDIQKLVVQQNKDARIQAKFSFYEPFSAADLVGDSGPPGSVCLRISVKTTPSSQPPEYLACVTADSQGVRFRGNVLREVAGGGPPRRVGAASVTHPTTHMLIVRFSPAVIGKPKRLRFAGEATQQVGCPGPRGCFDRAPNSVRTRGFDLRS